MAEAHEHDRRTWLMMVLHFWHGGRNSEIINLTRDNFVGRHVIFNRGKHSLPCKQELVEHKNPLFNERPAVFDYLRTLGKNQKLFPVSRWTYWRHMKKVALAAGIDPVKAKTTVLKHSLCTYMYENVGPNFVQRRAGHRSGNSTLKYGTVQEAQVDSLIVDAVGL